MAKYGINTSKYNIGYIANRKDLKTSEYGYWEKVKNPKGDKPQFYDQFRYNDKGIEKLAEYIREDN